MALVQDISNNSYASCPQRRVPIEQSDRPNLLRAPDQLTHRTG